jgi:hypothetical protein
MQLRKMKGLVILVFFCSCVFSVSGQRICIQEQRTPNDNTRSTSSHQKPRDVGVNKLLTQRSAGGNAPKGQLPEVIVIPVVVHILYFNEHDNISDAQVMSQLDVLNEDFRGKNPNRNEIPELFASLAADCGIEFRLATTDPKGYMTTGINRKKTGVQHFRGTNMKFSSLGGVDAWDTEKYLNIWVCRMIGGVMGSSSDTSSTPELDGVVISNACFGRIGNLTANFNRGRTATHEIGHWLNLRHTWGDTYCGDDYVDDTPRQAIPNKGCPKSNKQYHWVHCGDNRNIDMYMNFMDYTNDECMSMFTFGQRDRMRALFVEGGRRASLLQSPALQVSGIEAPTPVIEIPVEVSLYPNPAVSFLSVNIKGETGVKETVFSIHDRFGQPVVKGTLQSSKQQIPIHLLKPGMYYLHILGKTTKFVKM